VRRKGPYSLLGVLKTLEKNRIWPYLPKLNDGIFPQLPETSLGYKRLLHNLFELPEPADKKGTQQSYIIPLNVSCSASSADTESAVDEDLISQVWDLLPPDTPDEVVDLTGDLDQPHPSELNPEWEPPAPSTVVQYFTVTGNISV